MCNQHNSQPPLDFRPGDFVEAFSIAHGSYVWFQVEEVVTHCDKHHLRPKGRHFFVCEGLVRTHQFKPRTLKGGAR